MKKVLTKICALALTLALSATVFAGCTNQNGNASASAGQNSDKVFKVGLIQFMQHPSLDEITTAIKGEVTDKGYGEQIVFDVQNAQGDMSNI
ncbi:MAG: peptide ABC transporter substrate-binding protein, partial [Oscillospiraceae bacterium]